MEKEVIDETQPIIETRSNHLDEVKGIVAYFIDAASEIASIPNFSSDKPNEVKENRIPFENYIYNARRLLLWMDNIIPEDLNKEFTLFLNNYKYNPARKTADIQVIIMLTKRMNTELFKLGIIDFNTYIPKEFPYDIISEIYLED